MMPLPVDPHLGAPRPAGGDTRRDGSDSRHVVSDSRRDAERYRNLLLALDQAASEMRSFELQGRADLDDALDRLLPHLAQALGAEQAFEAVLREGTESKWFELVVVYPRTELRGERLEYTSWLADLVTAGKPRVFQPYEEEPPAFLPGLEIFKATSAVLAPVQTSGPARLVGMCNRADPDQGPYLAVDRMALEYILGLISLGVGVGERRRRELETLLATSTAIRSEQELEVLLPLIAGDAAQVFNAPAASLMLWDDDQSRLKIVASQGLSEEYIQQQRISRSVVLGARAATAGKRTLVRPDLRSEPFGQIELIVREHLCSVMSTELLVSDELIGILNIYSKETGRDFTQDEIDLAEIFANQAAVAIRNARLRQRVFDSLLTTSKTMKAMLDLDAMFNCIIDQAQQVFNAPAASLMLWDETEENLTLRASHGLSDAYVQRQRIPRSRIQAVLAADGEPRPLLTPDLLSQPLGDVDLYRAEGLYSALSVPLHSGQGLIGVLNIYSKDQPREFRQADIELATFFADQAATAIEIAQLNQRNRQRGEQLLALDQIALDISRRRETRNLLRAIVQRAAELVHGEGGGIYLWREVDEQFVAEAVSGLPVDLEGQLLPADRGVIGEVYRSRHPIRIADYSHWPGKRADLTKFNLTTVIGVPIFSGDHFLGVIAVHIAHPGRVFQSADEEMLVRFACHAAVALENASAYSAEQQATSSLNVVVDTISTVAQANDLTTGLNALAQNMVQGVGASFCHIFLLDEQDHSLCVEAAYPVRRPNSLPLEWQPEIGKRIRFADITPMLLLFHASEPQIFRKGDPVNGIDVIAHVRRAIGLESSLESVLVLPLGIEGRMLGLCTLGEVRSWNRSPFSIEKQSLASSIARQAVVFIDRMRAFEARQRRLRQSEILREISQDMAQLATHTSKEILDRIAQGVCEVVGADCAVIYPYLAELGIYDVGNIGVYNLHKDKQFSPKPRREKTSLTGIVLGRSESLIVDDVNSGWDRGFRVNIQALEGKFMHRERVRSFVGRGLRVGSEIVGVLFVNYRHLYSPLKDDLDNIEMFADQAAVAIQQARLFQQARKDHQAIQAAHQITRLTSSRDKPQSVWQEILKAALQITGAQRGQMLRWNEQCTLLTRETSRGLRGSHKKPASEFDASLYEFFRQVMKEKTGRMILDTGVDPHAASFKEFFPRARSLLITPISRGADGKPVGLILLESHELAAFGIDDRRLMDNLAVYADIAVQSARRYTEIQRNARMQEGLLKAGQGMIALQDPQAIFSIIAENALRALACDVVVLCTYDEESGDNDMPAIYRGELRYPEVYGHVPLDPGSVARRLLETGQPYFADPAAEDAIVGKGGFVRREQIQAAAGIPLRVGEQAVGLLFINYRDSHHFTSQEKETIQLFATQAAIAIHNARLYHGVEQKRLHLEALYEAGKVIATAGAGLDRCNVLDAILKEAVESVTGQSGPKATIGTIQFLNEANELVFESIYPPNKHQELLDWIGDRMPLDCSRAKGGKIGITGRVALTRRPTRVKDVRLDPDFVDYRADSGGGDTRSELAVPMLDGGRLLGVLNVESDWVNGFDKNDEDALMALADLAVAAIKNTEQAEQLSRTNTVAVMGAWGADIMHTINGEVGAIRLSTYLLMQDPNLTPEIRKQLLDIDQYAENLSLPELPQQPTEPGNRFQLAEPPFLDQVVEAEIEHFINTRRPSVKVDFQQGCSQVRVAIHEQWLRRLLSHLLNNANKAISSGHKNPLITIRTALQGVTAEIQVEDNANGVRPEIQPLLFHQPIPHEVGRNGQGLLLVRFLVEQHGGTARLLWTRLGEGSCFVLYIPVVTRNVSSTVVG